MSGARVVARELDCRIAREVFEFKLTNPDPDDPCDEPTRIIRGGTDFTEDYQVPRYSTDIGEAWMVVERMERCGWDATIRRTADGASARFESDEPPCSAYASADVRSGGAALAICLAALRAKERTA